jgi:tRNA-Thr(GGU) m(6)t(6)A37 methyltransferase TsaA
MIPIGTVRSPYVERFGCPRQPNVVTNTLGGGNLEGRIELTGLDPEKAALALRGLDGFSYIHVIYVCHLNTGWTPLIQPPRGPRVKQGVYATRSPHRPNMIGLSLLRIKSVDAAAGVIHFLGGDVIDGTPVIDIKPFIPHYDAPIGKIRIGWLEGIDDIVGEPDTLKYSGPAMSILAPSRALHKNRERAASA